MSAVHLCNSEIIAGGMYRGAAVAAAMPLPKQKDAVAAMLPKQKAAVRLVRVHNYVAIMIKIIIQTPLA